LHHARICEEFPNELLQAFLHSIGQVNVHFTRVKQILIDIATGINDDNAEVELTENRNSIANILDNLPRIDYFENLTLTCDNKSFFETLIMSTKNITLSVQNLYFKLKSMTKDKLKKDISLLKNDYVQNQVEIFRLESRLSRIIHNDLKAELQSVRNFERLNDEKITPFLCHLQNNHPLRQF
jgi:hypothetical protein